MNVAHLAQRAGAPSAATSTIRRGLLERHESTAALLLSAALVWLAQFHHLLGFGLYEDDYWFVSEAMGQQPSYLLARLETAARLPQGRPIGFFLPDLLSFLGDKLGGLPGIYILGFLVVTLNTFLCYRVLRVRMPMAAAGAGAAMFCLFGADTTKILLTHDFQLQPSLTFALASALLYARGRLVLAYVVAAGSLLSYENGYLPLFALPLLLRRWDRLTRREMVRHVAMLLGIMLAAVAIRIVVGEPRAADSVGGFASIVPKLLISMVYGPLRSLTGVLAMPLRALPGWDLEALLLSALAMATFGALFWRLPRPARAWRELTEVASAGVVMLVLAYALAFTHFPPSALMGRGTSVHLGATLGMAVVAGAAAWALLTTRARARAVSVGLLASYFALAVGYYVTIERDFVRSWQLQRGFWQQVAACCTDLQDGTVLLYEQPPVDDTSYIATSSWGDALVLTQAYHFPSSWSTPPRLFSTTDWQTRVQADGDHLRWWVPAASWDEHWEVLPQANVILLRRRSDGSLERVTGSVELAGQQLQLKAPAAPVAWPPAQLHAPLMLP